MMGIPLIIFFPILFILCLKEKWHPIFFKIAKYWAGFVMYASGFIPKRVDGVFYEENKSFMFIANHTSILDIMMIFYTIKNPFVFVGKKELTKIPVFGYFYKSVSILVDRKSPKSRAEVFKQAQHKIDLGFSICIFPEGGVPEDESIILDNFKDGAFRLSIDHKLPIVPFVFPDNKKRFSYTFFSGSLGKTRAYILPKQKTEHLTLEDKNTLKKNLYQQIFDKLMELH